MKKLALLILLLLSSEAHAITCQTEAGKGGKWAWRNIEGKRCWYQGAPGMDKSKLRWPAPTKAKAKLPTDLKEVDTLLHSYWPPLPPPSIFQERFYGR